MEEECSSGREVSFEKLAETSPAAITKVDKNGQIVYANDRAQEVLGLEKSEITDRTYDDPNWRITDLEGNDFPSEKFPFQVVKRTEDPVYDVRHAIEWPDGERILLSVNASPLFDENGNFDGMVAVIEDITEKEQAEKTREELLKNIKERNKELSLLYEIIKLSIDKESSLEATLKKTANLIPSSWQYPDITKAKITYEGKEFKSANFESGRWKQTAPIKLGEEKVGKVEVQYVEEKPEIDEGPFLKEERRLIDSVALILSKIIAHERIEQRKRHLDSILRAIRDINRLLVKTSDREKIVEETCKTLVNARDYGQAWGVLFDESANVVAAVQEGVGEEFQNLVDRIKAGQFPPCVKKPLDQSEIAITLDPSSHCYDCPLADTFQGNGSITGRLEYNGQKLGLLSASASARFLKDDQEQELFQELVEDISFGLHKIAIEEDLIQSREKFRSYVENAPLGVFIVDENGNYLEVNEAACELTGYTEEELLDMRITDIPPPEEVDKAMEEFEELAERGEMKVETPYLKKDGTKGVMVINAVKLSEDRYLGFTMDVTKRKEAQERLREATLGTLQALNRTIEAKDEYTGEHIDRVQEISVELGKRLGLSDDQLEQLRYAAILHDIGKIGVPDSILGKPGKLTEEEWDEIEKHPEMGEKIVGQVDQLQQAATIIGQHQEKFDGSGYPRGLAEDEITLEARIIAVADAWDAMRTERPYREALPKKEAIKELKENAGTQFDPELVDILLEMVKNERLEYEES